MDVKNEDKKRRGHCGRPMDVSYEDRKLHKDGIFDGFFGYKEWFHYEGTFYVNGGKPLGFVLGFPGSLPGFGALGWISFEGNQYSLAGNIEKHKDGFYKLRKLPVEFDPSESGYTLKYSAEPQPHQVYEGTVEGRFPENEKIAKGNLPEYRFDIKTPDLHLQITLKIQNPCESVYTRKLCPWISGGWFHSGDVTASLSGSIKGTPVSSDSQSRGWYERNWSKIPLFLPAHWFWFMTHVKSGEVFNLLIERFLRIRVPFLDECWLYREGTFHEFHDYKAEISPVLKRAIKDRNYSETLEQKIECEGTNGKDTFTLTGTVTDFRQYEFHSWYAAIKWTNLFIETEGEAVIDKDAVDLKGRGVSERCPITYWWL